MNEKNRMLLGNLWLIASLSALVLPVFIPSYPRDPGFFSNVIELSTITMFLMSFPSSLFGSPFLYASYKLLGIDTYSIGGMYTHLSMLFVLGAVQWFWIVPRIWFGGPEIQTLGNAISQLQPAKEVEFHRFSSRDRTPVERIMDEED